MKKKPAHKRKSSTSHRIKRSSEQTAFWYTVIVFSLILMVFASVGYKLSKPHVLGASTVFLAQGDESGIDGAPGGSGTGVISGGTANGSNPPTQNSGVAAGAPSISDSTPVDCVGPDGKHFTAEYHNCQELNQKWGNSTFNFTPLSGSQNQPSAQGDSQTPEIKSHTSIQTPQGHLEIQTDGSKRQVNLESNGLHVEFKKEDNGTVSAVAKQESGPEVKLSGADALAKLNSQLKNQDIEISSAEGGLAITKGDVEAQTHFPLSVNAATGQLTVTTPAGTRAVSVLPDKAVQNLLATGVFSGVTSQGSTTGTGTTQQVQLTDINGTPAYQVQGVISKKLLGLFPMSYAQTAFVSAQDGHTIEVQQSPLTSFLSALSF